MNEIENFRQYLISEHGLLWAKRANHAQLRKTRNEMRRSPVSLI